MELSHHGIMDLDMVLTHINTFRFPVVCPWPMDMGGGISFTAIKNKKEGGKKRKARAL
jgi:hypothetical protein